MMMTAALQAASRAKAASPAPLIWYTMDNISGGVLIDEMGNYDAQIVGAVQTPGSSGQALAFLDQESYIKVAVPAFNQASGFTITLRVSPGPALGSAGSQQKICTFGALVFWLQMGENQAEGCPHIRLLSSDGVWGDYCVYPGIITNTTKKVGLRIVGDTATLVIGDVTITDTIPEIKPATVQPYYGYAGGREDKADTGSLNGWIDELRVFETALSDEAFAAEMSRN